MQAPQANTSLENHTHENKSSQSREVLDQYGLRHICRALLDGESQSNFITKKLCRKLSLKVERINHTITGVNLTHNNINEIVHVDI